MVMLQNTANNEAKSVYSYALRDLFTTNVKSRICCFCVQNGHARPATLSYKVYLSFIYIVQKIRVVDCTTTNSPKSNTENCFGLDPVYKSKMANTVDFSRIQRPLKTNIF